MSFPPVNIPEAAWQAAQNGVYNAGNIILRNGAVKLDEADDVVANLMCCSLFSYVGARIGSV